MIIDGTEVARLWYRDRTPRPPRSQRSRLWVPLMGGMVVSEGKPLHVVRIPYCSFHPLKHDHAAQAAGDVRGAAGEFRREQERIAVKVVASHAVIPLGFPAAAPAAKPCVFQSMYWGTCHYSALLVGCRSLA